MGTDLLIAGTALTVYDVLTELAASVAELFIDWLFDSEGEPVIVNGQHSYQITDQDIYNLVNFNLLYVYDSEDPIYSGISASEFAARIVQQEYQYNVDISSGLTPDRSLNFYCDTDYEIVAARTLQVQKENAAANTNTSGILMYSVGVTAPFALLFAFNSILSWFKKTFIHLKGRNANVGLDR